MKIKLVSILIHCIIEKEHVNHNSYSCCLCFNVYPHSSHQHLAHIGMYILLLLKGQVYTHKRRDNDGYCGILDSGEDEWN